LGYPKFVPVRRQRRDPGPQASPELRPRWIMQSSFPRAASYAMQARWADGIEPPGPFSGRIIPPSGRCARCPLATDHERFFDHADDQVPCVGRTRNSGASHCRRIGPAVLTGNSLHRRAASIQVRVIEATMNHKVVRSGIKVRKGAASVDARK